MKAILSPMLTTLAGLLRSRAVQGRAAGTTTTTRNEILSSFNKPEDSIQAIVEFVEPSREFIGGV